MEAPPPSQETGSAQRQWLLLKFTTLSFASEIIRWNVSQVPSEGILRLRISQGELGFPKCESRDFLIQFYLRLRLTGGIHQYSIPGQVFALRLLFLRRVGFDIM